MSKEHQPGVLDDLVKHAARELQITLNRHFEVMQQVLSPSDCALAIMMIANGVATGGAYYALQVRQDGKDPAELWDLFGEQLPKLFMATKPMVLAKLEETAS